MSVVMTDAAACPVCGCRSGLEFLRRPSVPVHQHLLLSTPAQAKGLTRGDLVMHLCSGCGFARNVAFDERLLQYGAEYDNTQTHSPAFNRYVDDLLDRVVRQGGVSGRRVVEVGCGKGTFLKKLIAYPGADNVGFGFDPTYLGPDSEFGGRLNFVRTFYDPASGPPADVIVSRHVIEHVVE